MSNSELKTRVKTAVILVLPLVCLLFASVEVAGARLCLNWLGFLALGMASFEFARVCSGGRGLLYQIIYTVPCLLTPLLMLFIGSHVIASAAVAWELTAMTLVAGLFFSFLAFVVGVFVVGRDASIASRELAQDLPIGIFLLGLCGGCLVALPTESSGVLALTWLLVVVIANDVGAYFVGKAIGGPKLAPYLSPKKTVSGSLGGLAIGVLCGGALSFLLPEEVCFVRSSLLAVLTGIAGQGGDLIKSYVKRLHAVKDMGTILPGHGGVLDRIDGLLAAAPVVYLLLLVRSF